MARISAFIIMEALSIALIISGVLMLPPFLGNTLQGPDKALASSGLKYSYKESLFGTHLGWIDTGKNGLIAALGISAGLLFDTYEAQITAALLAAVSLYQLGVQVYAPIHEDYLSASFLTKLFTMNKIGSFITFTSAASLIAGLVLSL